jgi:dTDP-4-dehydrorhamnose reductase
MKIILFGSTGMLGTYIHSVLKNKYEVICIIRDEYDVMKNTWNDLEQLFILNENDVVINSIGIIPQKTCSIQEYIKVNSIFPHMLNHICKKYKSNYIHITTDCVYNGKKGNYDQDEHDSDTIYGITKSLGECDDATIIRTSIIGEERYGKKSLLEWVISNKGKEINGYKNHYWNGVTCLTLANIIYKMIDENNFWRGVKNISSEIITKLELCQYINEIYELNIKINPIDVDYKNLSLKSSDIFKVDTIYNQIKEQKNYKIK